MIKQTIENNTIPKFPEPDFVCKMAIQELDDYIANTNSWNLNPQYFRRKSWNVMEKSAYIEYLLRGGKESRTIRLNSPDFWGADTDAPHITLDNSLVCIDGYKRLRAITGFYNNEVPAFGRYYKDMRDILSENITIDIEFYGYILIEDIVDSYLQYNKYHLRHAPHKIQCLTRFMEAQREDTKILLDEIMAQHHAIREGKTIILDNKK